MKKYLSILLCLCIPFALAACSNTTPRTNSQVTSAAETSDTETSVSSGGNSAASEQSSDGTSSSEAKILVAFFSRADENYGVGIIEKGNTQIIAEMIADETGGELFHIERETPYPADYDECTDEAKEEQNNNTRPALKDDIDISDYDVIFLGYPIWWGDMPMPVYTFLEAHGFSGKTVIPFCTHAGSGLGGTESNIKSTTGATMPDGLAIPGTTAQNKQDEARKSVQEWLENLNLPK